MHALAPVSSGGGPVLDSQKVDVVARPVCRVTAEFLRGAVLSRGPVPAQPFRKRAHPVGPSFGRRASPRTANVIALTRLKARPGTLSPLNPQQGWTEPPVPPSLHSHMPPPCLLLGVPWPGPRPPLLDPRPHPPTPTDWREESPSLGACWDLAIFAPVSHSLRLVSAHGHQGRPPRRNWHFLRFLSSH